MKKTGFCFLAAAVLSFGGIPCWNKKYWSPRLLSTGVFQRYGQW